MNLRGPRVIIAPEAPPLTIDECRAHLEAAAYGDTTLDDADDAMIAGFLAAAVQDCEQFVGLSLSQRVLEVEIDAFPSVAADGTDEIALPFGPVIEVRSFDPTGGSSSSSEAVVSYDLDDYSSPNRLRSVGGWPAGGPIRIQYLAGFGLDSDGLGVALPAPIRAAVLLMLGHLYANREAATDKAMTALPLGVESMLRPFRVRLGLA